MMMKFTCNTGELNQGINSALLAVSPKSTLLALEGILVRVTTKEITDKGVKFLDKDGKEHFAEADYVYYCCGNRSNDDTVKSLEGVTPWFVVTGDAKRARTVKQATYEGFCAAMDIL